MFKNPPLFTAVGMLENFLKNYRFAVNKLLPQGQEQEGSSALVFETPNSKAVRTVVTASDRTTTVEVAAICDSAIYRTTPVATAAAHQVERTTAVVAEACNGKLQ